MRDINNSLLAIAAEMRAAGASWEKIGQEVGRHQDTCRHWPERYPATWHRLFLAAEERHIATGGSEALTALRIMLRKGSERAQLSAAQTLYRGRLAARYRSYEPHPSDEERIAIELPHLASKEERDCLTEKPIQALKRGGRKRRDGDAAQACEQLEEAADRAQAPAESGSKLTDAET
jgi:hypothetical protein